MFYDSLLLVTTISAFVVGFVCAGALSYWQNRRVRHFDAKIAGLSADAQAVLNAYPGSSIILSKNGRVIRADASVVAYGLVDGEKVTNQSMQDLVSSERPSGSVTTSEIQVTQGPAHQWMHDGVGVTGTAASPAILRVTVAPLLEEMTLILIEDVTRARRLNATRRDFTANVSHELKTPVGAIALLAETLAECGDDRESRDYFVERLGKESRRLKALVADIIELSRLQDSQDQQFEEPVEVSRVVSEALESVTTAATEKQIELEYRQCPGLWQVRGDHRLLTMAVRNLLDNAVRYSSPGSQVEMQVQVEPWTVAQLQQGEVSLENNAAKASEKMVENPGVETEPAAINPAQAKSISITVKDNGPGIAQSEQERVFERFYRVDSARSRQTGGTGLGLSIVKHVMADHGGIVTLESVLGEGSKFSLILPLIEAETENSPVRIPGANATAKAMR